jgi:hypothetical protein
MSMVGQLLGQSHGHGGIRSSHAAPPEGQGSSAGAIAAGAYSSSASSASSASRMQSKHALAMAEQIADAATKGAGVHQY